MRESLVQQHGCDFVFEGDRPACLRVFQCASTRVPDAHPQDVIYRGNMTAQFQNMLKPDAMVLGNHEFDYGSNMTATYVR